MPALNFKERFAPAVQNGRKRQTIRKKWKRPIKVGQPLYLKTGMRTKRCRPLGEATCSRIRPLAIFGDGEVRLDGDALSLSTVHELARLDGFESVDDFIAFFRDLYGLPFEGDLIEW